jgi:hypothetical protein
VGGKVLERKQEHFYVEATNEIFCDQPTSQQQEAKKACVLDNKYRYSLKYRNISFVTRID